MASAMLHTPITSPTPSSVPAERVELTSEQQTKFDWLLEQARKWTDITVPKKDGKDAAAAGEQIDLSGPLTDAERMWVTRECLIRYLKATRWNQEEAERRVLGTLAWRREYGIAPDQTLTPEHISPENETGKQLLLGYDMQGRPCQYLNPGRQNTDPSPRQVQHLVFMVERVIDLMPPGVETLSLLINFKQSKGRSNTAPGIGLAREVLNILQTHYPERLGRALIINVPFLVWGFFKLITPFVDPVTREKLKFNEDMTQYVPKEQLWAEWGGDLKFDYEHAEYWPALMALCTQKRAERLERWQKGGKQIGELEDYLTGKVDIGVAGGSAAAKVEEDLEMDKLKIEDKPALLNEKVPEASENEQVTPAPMATT
jgi:hypothetical protein